MAPDEVQLKPAGGSPTVTPIAQSKDTRFRFPSTLPLLSFSPYLLFRWVLDYWACYIAPNEYLYYPTIIMCILFFAWAILHYPAMVRKDRIVDSWDMLIADAKGKGQSVYQDMEKAILQTKPPKVHMRKRKVWPGIIRGLFGERRPFFIVINKANSNLKAYRMYVNAMDYGTNLQVVWYLVHEPGLWRRTIAILMCIPVVGIAVLPIYLISRLLVAGKSGILQLDVFDEQDLRAFATNVHHCILGAVEKLMTDLGQDTTDIKRQSRGFLGIS